MEFILKFETTLSDMAKIKPDSGSGCLVSGYM